MNVAVFGGGDYLGGSPIYEMAQKLGQLLAKANHVVYIGGSGGVMDASAKGAKEAKGKVRAVAMGNNPQVSQFVKNTEVFLIKGCSLNVQFCDYLCQILEKADAYVFMNGGIGTFVELLAALRIAEYQMTKKPIIFLGDWSKTIEFLGSIGADLKHVISTSNPEEVLRALEAA